MSELPVRESNEKFLTLENNAQKDDLRVEWAENAENLRTNDHENSRFLSVLQNLCGKEGQKSNWSHACAHGWTVDLN